MRASCAIGNHCRRRRSDSESDRPKAKMRMEIFQRKRKYLPPRVNDMADDLNDTSLLSNAVEHERGKGKKERNFTFWPPVAGCQSHLKKKKKHHQCLIKSNGDGQLVTA